MDISSVNSDIIRGNVTTIILSSLWSGDRYGYDILKEIETKSEGQYKLKQPTLYNQLKRLEKQGLITSYDGDPEDTGGGRRKYYSLTEEGRAYIQKEKREYEYSRTILDKLVSSQEFDFENSPPPFNTAELRPYTKRDEGDSKEKVVYKDKVVEVEKIVEVEKVVEKKIYLDAYGNEISEEQAKLLAEEAAADVKTNYFNAPTPQKEQPSASLKDIFQALDEKEAEINRRIEEQKLEQAERERIIKEQEAAAAEQARLEREKALKAAADAEMPSTIFDLTEKAAENSASLKDYATSEPEAKRASSIIPEDKKDTFAISATLGKRDEAFDFEKENVNYRDFFSSIVSLPEEKPEPPKEKASAPSGDDLKTRLYSEGFKIRPYSKGNTSEYYSFNFLHSNRLNRDCFLIVLAIYLVETAIMWLSLSTRVSYVYFLPVIFIGAAFCLIPTIIYLFNPDKRVRANFNFKLSLLNRGMMFIELTVVAVLIGFFALGASVNDIDLILQSVVLPMVLLTNLPVSSLVHQLLYRSKRYHVA